MTRNRHRLSRLFVGGILALIVGALTLRAQEGGRLEADALKPNDEGTFSKLRNGDLPFNTTVHTPILEKKAKHLLYRLTWPEVQLKSVEGQNNTMAVSTLSQLYDEFGRALPDYKRIQAKEALKAEKQKRFVEEFSKQLVPCIDKVLKQGNSIARVNAAHMLAKLGEYGHEELADPLAAMLEDTAQIDAAKYYGAVGLRDLFKNAEKVKDERELRSIQALMTNIHRPPSFPPEAGKADIGGFVYVRRAFIAALGQAHKPALVQNRKVVCQPALELVRIVSKEGLAPEPFPVERIEAAIGLGNIQKKHYDKYQPDYAAYHVGNMLLDFFARYNIERQAESFVKREPWRIHAARLKESLQNMVADSKNPYVDQLQRQADGLFDQVLKNEAVSVKPFSDWLTANPPPSPSLYKDDPKAVVTLPKMEL